MTDFHTLNLDIPNAVKQYPVETQQDIFRYLNSLNDLDRKGYEIAFKHLGTSFSITRSNGFKQWKRQQT